MKELKKGMPLTGLLLEYPNESPNSYNEKGCKLDSDFPAWPHGMSSLSRHALFACAMGATEAMNKI